MTRWLVTCLIIVVVSVGLALADPCAGPPGSPCADDGNPCTDDVCDGLGTCTHPNNVVPCDDADACTTVDLCTGGVCVGAVALDCDDSNVCTDDRCDSGAGCINTNNGAPCDDGNACSMGDACSDGACNPGSSIDCLDADGCTTDVCDPALGCLHVANTVPCDDGNACTVGDRCGGGTCAGGAAADCDDGAACTDDDCNTASGCLHTNNTAPCDDGNACTMGEVCGAGVCSGGTVLACADGNLCTDDACDPGSGCVHTNNAASCDDGNACTTGDACAGGTCTGGPGPDCADGNPCTDDACSPASGCTHVDNAAACNDGSACTRDDVCSAGACVPGPAVECDDANACTTDSCAPATGCVHSAVPGCCNSNADCTDADRCTTNERCLGHMCRTDPVSCGDANPCTDDGCDPVSGCVYTGNSAPCDDGNACTTADACRSGGCVGGPALDCNDGQVCTSDSCAPATGCVHANNTLLCSDGDLCTTGDRCSGGACIGGAAADCDDGNPCTIDACSPATGCTHTNATSACDDGNACTTFDVCGSGGCVPGPARSCDDANPCTTDGCDPASGCVHTNNVLPCNDQNACTTVDRCVDGACTGWLALYCDDRNPCTTDGCDPGQGCTHVNNTIPCDDGLFCTVADVCAAGVCGGSPRDCSAVGDQCRVGTCDEAQDRCIGPPKPDGTTCSDGTVCTSGETCTAGRCTDGTTVTCGACESCEATVGCQTGPRPACHVSIVPLKSKLQIDDRQGTASDAVSWKLVRGDQTSVVELRDPLASNDFRLCVFDQGGGHLALRTDVPAGGTCRGKSCWKALGTRGFRYSDPTRTSDGVSKFVVITGSDAGSMKAQLKAKGGSLPPLHLPLTIPVVAQLESASGHCWKTRHNADGLLHDDARQFRALGD